MWVDHKTQLASPPISTIILPEAVYRDLINSGFHANSFRFAPVATEFLYGRDEEAEREAREEEWSCNVGELEQIEEEGRRVNGEAELALRPRE